MNQTQRIKALTEARRLGNMLSRSRYDLPEFAGRNKAEVDQLLAEIAKPLSKSKPRHRRWADLRPQDQERIAVKLGRRCSRRGYLPNNSIVKVWLSNMGLVGTIDNALAHIAVHSGTERSHNLGRGICFAGFKTLHHNAQRRRLRGSTPAERLQARRDFRINEWVNYNYPVLYTLYINLHPDDVSWDMQVDSQGKLYYSVSIARNFLWLQDKVFLAQEKPLAANLYLEDPQTRSEVYHCALLCTKGSPKVVNCFIGRCVNPFTKKPELTGRYKTAAGALKAAHNIFKTGLSKVLYHEPE